jgi:hypothetical protein
MRISISKLARLVAPALVLVLGACAGDSPDPVDRFCTKALYEFCITEHDCETEDCRPFAAEGYMICTQICDAARPCPDLNGTQVACTNGVCKPPEPVECQVMP